MNVAITLTPEELEEKLTYAWSAGYNAGHKDGLSDAILTEEPGRPRQRPWHRAQAYSRKALEYIVFKR